MADINEYKVVGEYVYEGVTFCCAYQPEQLEKVKNFKFFDDDVMVATYPKAGEYISILVLCHHNYTVDILSYQS